MTLALAIENEFKTDSKTSTFGLHDPHVRCKHILDVAFYFEIQCVGEKVKFSNDKHVFRKSPCLIFCFKENIVP